jgi:myo-inositol 2-dehydrogenase/D-chiro-inositol 1-dehydrogenase
MTGEAIRIGFVGAGSIAGVHAGILSTDERARVMHVFDPDADRVESFVRRFGAAAAPTLDDLLGSVDAVYICSPNALHADTAVRALDAGLHVFCEKPMATSLEDATRVLASAEKARGVYQAGFNRRFATVYKELRRWIEAHGPPASALIKMNRGELRAPAWTGDPVISGGFIYETPIHMLDLLRHLFGEPTEVVVRARSVVYPQTDNLSMLLTFASGMTAVFAASAHATWQHPFERIELYGDHRMAATEEMDRITYADGVDGASHVLDVSRQPFEERWGYIEEDRRFLDAMAGVCEAAVSAADAYATIEAVQRCLTVASGDEPT